MRAHMHRRSSFLAWWVVDACTPGTLPFHRHCSRRCTEHTRPWPGITHTHARAPVAPPHAHPACPRARSTPAWRSGWWRASSRPVLGVVRRLRHCRGSRGPWSAAGGTAGLLTGRRPLPLGGQGCWLKFRPGRLDEPLDRHRDPGPENGGGYGLPLALVSPPGGQPWWSR